MLFKFATEKPVFRRRTILFRSKVIALYSLLILSSSLLATDNNHESLIKQLFLVLELPRIYEQKVDTLVCEQKQRIEHFSYFEDVIRAWAVDTIGWKSLEPRLLEIYKKQFSENELRDILHFYRSTAGQKFLKAQPAINLETQQLAADAARENAHQLKIMLRKRADELEKKGIIKKRDPFQPSTPSPL